MTAKILLVEDELINLRLYQMMLSDNDYVFNTAQNGMEGLEKARTWAPDLILLDWNMPVMDGLEALERMKQDEVVANIPVLMVTGIMTTPEDLNRAMMMGAVDFMKKPFEKLELTARVRNMLLLSKSLNTLREKNVELENKNIFILSLIESIPHPVAYSLPDGTLKMCNRSFEEVLGKDRKDIIGQSAYRYASAENLDEHVRRDAELLEAGESISYETYRFSEKRNFILSKSVVFEAEKRPAGIVSVFTDVTDLKRANEEVINTKKVELISSTLKLMHLSEIHNNLINEMQVLLPHVNEKGKSEVTQLQNRYKANLREQVLNDFESRLESAFDSFFRVLGEKFPCLTQNERKLCALLRSGLSSKEIAVLTFQNPASVDVARYRLRKKMKLSNEDRLMDFLLMIDK